MRHWRMSKVVPSHLAYAQEIKARWLLGPFWWSCIQFLSTGKLWVNWLQPSPRLFPLWLNVSLFTVKIYLIYLILLQPSASKPKVATFVRYAKVELVPPKPTELGEVASGFGNVLRGFRTGAWRNLTVKEAWLNTLVTVEVLCWFFVGECIGKRSLIGYQV